MKRIYSFILILFPILSHAQFTFNTGFGIGNTGFESASAVAVDTFGNVYCVGSMELFLDLDPGPLVNGVNGVGASDGFLAKYSPSGSFLWGKASGGLLGDAFTCVAVDDVGNVYAAGSYEGSIDLGGNVLSSTGLFDIFLVKFDSQGQHIWSKSYGGTGSENANYLAVDNSGNNIALCGSFSNSMDMGNGPITSHGSTNAYVALFDANGDAQWYYGFGGSGTALDRANIVTLDNQGNVYVTGGFSGQNVDVDPDVTSHILNSNGSSDIFLVKYSNSGVFNNAFSIGGSKGELAGGIAVNTLGEIYFTGYSNSDSIDVNPDTASVYLYGDSGIAFVQDLIVLKYNSNLEYQWGFRTGRRATDSGQGLRIDSNGDLFITGVTGDANVDFDPGPGTHYLSGDSSILSNNSAFLAQYNSAGNLVDAFVLEGVASSGELALTNDGKVWICGYFRGTRVDLDPGVDSTFAVNSGQFDVLLSSYNYPLSVGINDLMQEKNLVYPKPSQDYVKLKYNFNRELRVYITDLSGKVQKELLIRPGENISLNGLKEGMYILTASDDKISIKEKIIKID